MIEYTIRPMRHEEIDEIANLIAAGYGDDIYFKWVVESDKDRHEIITNYYKAYFQAKGHVTHVAETPSKKIIGATLWLPHDMESSVYDEIDRVAGDYKDRFRAVSDNSHMSEPPMTPFYQLVGFVVVKEAQKQGIGAALLKHQIDHLDKLGIPTYLEASTPYYGGGAYGKFGYQPVGELMVFAENAVLYPLWRPASKAQQVEFGGFTWRVIETRKDKLLLLCDNVIEPAKYHDVFEDITWSGSSIRKHLNGSFYHSLSPLDKLEILETQVTNGDNPWFGTYGGEPTTDKIFLLSIEETVRYMGSNDLQKNPDNMFYIDDELNKLRKSSFTDGSPSRWLLRSPGNAPDFVSVVTVDGRISVTGDFVNRSSSDLFSVGIRPAMWIRNLHENAEGRD